MAVIVAIALVAAACSAEADNPPDGDASAADQDQTEDGSNNNGDDNDNGGSDAGNSESTEADDSLAPLELAIRPGPFQITVDEQPEAVSSGAVIEVTDTDGAALADTTFAENGTALIRELPEGEVDLQLVDGEVRYAKQRVVVPGEAADGVQYDGVELSAGLNYIPTRDGTTLSAFVSLPGSASGGPYPTLVEYSGYAPSNPEASNDPYRLLIPSLGYALVQVNVRGTGCSGGSFDAFERIQSLDGYDVIETVAAQPWSAKIGMFGVSYPGIMQLHVASTQPPSLAAIAPLSVTDSVESVLYPGGIYNDGFGENWSRLVSEQAGAGGQDWAADRITRGDQQCTENQNFRIHNPDLVDIIQGNPFVNDLSVERSAETYADQIAVPTFLGGAWQDEQTGGRFPALLDELENAPVLRATLYNGLHLDAISGEMLVRLIEFINLYVGDRSAEVDPVVRVLVGVGLAGLFGDQLELPPGRYDGLSVEDARAAFEAEPPIRVLFDQGAEQPNLPVPGFDATFEQWPPAPTEATTFYLAEAATGVGLSDEPPTADVTADFTTDPAEGQRVTIDDLDNIWTNEPGWSWAPAASENAAFFDGPALEEDLVAVGSASADLWVSVADGTDADLEVTLSELAPDGSETYVQAGWLRLSRRALSDEATELRPAISGLEADVAPVTAGGDPVLARVEILPFAHAFRAGSRIRITVDTPGGSRPQWRFDVADEAVQVTIHSGAENPSKIVLPAIPGLDVPTERPVCGSLRGQPCRQG